MATRTGTQEPVTLDGRQHRTHLLRLPFQMEPQGIQADRPLTRVTFVDPVPE